MLIGVFGIGIVCIRKRLFQTVFGNLNIFPMPSSFPISNIGRESYG